jgi:hypothetical protein
LTDGAPASATIAAEAKSAALNSADIDSSQNISDRVFRGFYHADKAWAGFDPAKLHHAKLTPSRNRHGVKYYYE